MQHQSESHYWAVFPNLSLVRFCGERKGFGPLPVLVIVVYWHGWPHCKRIWKDLPLYCPFSKALDTAKYLDKGYLISWTHCMFDPSALYKISDPWPRLPFISACAYSSCKTAATFSASVSCTPHKSSAHWHPQMLKGGWEKHWQLANAGSSGSITSEQEALMVWEVWTSTRKKSSHHYMLEQLQEQEKKTFMNILASIRRAKLTLPSPSLASHHPCN